MKTTYLLTVVAFFAAFAELHRPTMAAEEIGFIERFALAADREAVLDELIPGTEDYYYFNALHHQNEGRYGEVEQVLEPWVKRHGETARVWEIRNRQALLLYPNQPEKSLAYLRERLGLRFDHQRQEIGKKPNLPTALDPKAISWEAFRSRAFANSRNLDRVEDSGLDRILRTEVELDPTRRRAMLARLKYPDYPNLVGLIAADLRTKESKGFGEFGIHRALLPGQLDKLADLRPDLVNNQNFVHTQLAKLAPSEDVDWRRNSVEREAYLNRMWAYLQPLSTAFNSLKAHVLYQLLAHHRQQGEYPRQLFLDYVKLPRPVPYAEPRWLNRAEHRGNAQVNLNSDYRSITRMPPIGGHDEKLVRDYLAEFFIEDQTWEGFAPYIRDTWLKPVFAEAKIVNGIGDAEKWSSLLSPAAFKALRDRVDVEFVASNEVAFGAGDAVSLDLHVKNVETLMVKVYEINALNFYLEEKREINTDLNLDGLVSNSEQTQRYEEGPLRRVRRTFEFPDLADKRGTWVIEFIGNGISSRALVRKGRLQYLAHPSAAGTVLTVLDAKNQPAKSPAAWFGGRRYTPDEKGLIVVPFSQQGGSQPLVLTDVEGDKADGLATLEQLDLASEDYQLEAGFHVDRETLLPGQRTTVAVRPRLTLNGSPLPTALLENVRLRVGFVDADGVESLNDVEDFELHDDRESEYVFRVPERVRMVAFMLEAQVEQLSAGGEKVDLSSSDMDEETGLFELNAIDDSQFVGDLQLSRIDGTYVLEALGKTGEPLADRAVRLTLKHRHFRDTINVSLKSGANGRVQLGKLGSISHLRVTAANLPARSWPLAGDRHTYTASMHAAEGAIIEVPLMASADGKSAPDKLGPADVALFEIRGGTPVDTRYDALSVSNGLVSIKGLAPGNYQLVLRPPSAAASSAGRVIELRVTQGAKTKGYVLGRDRHLQVKNARPLQVASLSTDDEFIRIQLKNADAFTRVHVAATRFIPDYSLFPRLGTPMWTEPIAIDRGSSESRYVSGRDIGEEYRYILERRGKERFPGNMLARPGLILNPWELRKTDTTIVTAAEGEDYQKSEASKATSRGGRAPAKPEPSDAFAAEDEDLGRSLDFLFHQSVVSYNLAADENGVVTLKRADLGDRQQLHVLAVNTANSAYRQLSLPEADGGAEFGDLRLTRSLEVDGHFSQRRKVTMLRKGDELRIADRRASEMEIYDTLAGVYATLSGIGEDPTLAEFSFILSWPSLEAERKQELYSEYACHELNFFLSRRDPDFFATVVQPYLANKKDKTFFDEYLLEKNLSRYLEAWRYGRLNTVERILLARRLGGDEPAATARHVREGWELLPLDPAQQQHWFRQALRGRAGAADYGYIGGGGADGVAALNFSKEQAAGSGLMAKRRSGAALRQLSGAMQEQRESESAPAPGAVAATPPAPDSRGRAFNADQKMDEAKKQVALAAVVMDVEQDLAEIADLSVASSRKELQRLRRQVRANFRKLAETSEWAENNYYHRPIEEQVAELITVNAFWRDYAEWNGDGGFYSRDFPTASNSFAEMLLALAVLDLPFESGEHDIEVENQALTLTAASPAVVFHEEIEAVPVADNPPPVLVSQNFFREGDRVRYEGNEQVDKFVTDEFLTGVLYGGQVVITNPTSSNQRLEVLLQVPVGALPANGSDYTRSRPIQLGAFSTERLEYFFYFPASSGDGNFAHYPVHVAKQEEAIAWADAFTFKVVDELSIIDKSSWEYLSQHGSKRQVIDFLEQNNPQRIDLALIAWRVREDVDFMRQVTKLLDARHVFDATLWSYGIHHNLVPTARQFLLHREDFLSQSGRWLECELVSIEPVERHWYQHLDYRPLVNARRHQLGRERKILNDRFRSQYQELMRVLSYRSEFNDTDNLAISGYLLLQDRIAEGLARLASVERDNVTAHLQFDYLSAYSAFFQGEPAVAAQIAAGYADYPVDRWRERFAQVATQVTEIRGAGDGPKVTEEGDRSQQQAALAASEPAFDFQVEGQRVSVTHRNLDALQVNYYEMDLEFLFSSNPFVARDSSRFRFIRPNVTQLKPLDDADAADAAADAEAAENDDRTLAFDIPKRFRGKNVLIEIVGAGIRKAEAYYANDLSVQMVENYGHLQVRQSDNGQPLPRAYVKVYARFNDGSVKFFKDGYTDLRGKFDYVSLNTDELGAVDRFAVLVMSEKEGSLVREAGPPQQ